MRFEITTPQHSRIREWLRTEVYPKVIAEQKADPSLQNHSVAAEFWEDGYPYDGAIGGGLTYEFTPNSIGVSVWVRYRDHKLDLTDYDSW